MLMNKQSLRPEGLKKYFPKDFEKKWQDKWEEAGIYAAQNDDTERGKKYILDMFPYPSGDGLHVGHFKGYVASDIISRYYRLKGYNVLHPMGWDAFGLPAENYAIKTGIHPKITTVQNIANIKRQMQIVGLSYDWSREIDTTDPNYYKWTQWIFLKLFEHGLAYEDEVPINWCPKDKTGLANEEVVNGACERCGTKVERKVIRQWILRITKYADRLIEDLDSLDWPQFIKEMQVNWIGRKTGINITYNIEGSQETVTVFTTRPDTNFGATFIVLGPEHPLIKKITTTENSEAVDEYIKVSLNKSEEDRIAQGRAKTGAFTGAYAINNLNGKKMPVWVSDFVLGNVGTGAVVGVPGHDLRDFEFAKEFGLEIIRVVKGKDGDTSSITEASQVQEEQGVMVNSDFLDGLDIHDATVKIMDYLEEKGWGERVVNYHLRDWLFSRQRYWGEPIPLVHCDKDGIVAIPESELPLKLPEVEKYEPTGTGESPLAGITEWVNTTCPKCGGPAKRETNTMPQWAGSCWYYLRFADPGNREKLISKEIEKYWLPVDWYIGGAEHAVLHLLYSRFWHKFLFDIGAITTKEPFQKLTSVGLVLAEGGQKMSKSKGNVVTPETIINEYGADSLRVYESFMGPFDNTISWDPKSINGVYKFLSRVWEIIMRLDIEISDKVVEVGLNRLINKVGSDIESMKFNTSVAAMMEFLNLSSKVGLSKDQKKKFLIILAPFAPHISEELWQAISHQPSAISKNSWSIHQQKWPEVSGEFLEEEEVTIVIQVNGKVRDSFVLPKTTDEKNVLEKAKGSEKVSKFLTGEIKKTIFISGKILNIVI
jgi:leucyl-tRNA synthetase